MEIKLCKSPGPYLARLDADNTLTVLLKGREDLEYKAIPGTGMALFHKFGHRIVADFGIREWVCHHTDLWIEFPDQETREWFTTGAGSKVRWVESLTDGEIPPKGMPVRRQDLILLALLGKNKTLFGLKERGTELIEEISRVYGDSSLAPQSLALKTAELRLEKEQSKGSKPYYHPDLCRRLPDAELTGMEPMELKEIISAQESKFEPLLAPHLAGIFPELATKLSARIALGVLDHIHDNRIDIIPLIEAVDHLAFSYKETSGSLKEIAFDLLYLHPDPERPDVGFRRLAKFFFNAEEVLRNYDKVQLPWDKKKLILGRIPDPITPAQTLPIWERHAEVSLEFLFGAVEKKGLAEAIQMDGTPFIHSTECATAGVRFLLEAQKYNLLLELIEKRAFSTTILPDVISAIHGFRWVPERYTTKQDFHQKLGNLLF